MDSSPPAAPPTAEPPPGFVRVASKLEGITVYAPAPPPVPPEQPSNFKCPNCGATTAFDPRAGSVTCSNCGSVYALEAKHVGDAAPQFEFTLDLLKSAPRGWGSTRRELHCENCGATTSVAPTELSTTCPFCGSNRVAARKGIPDAFRPRYLIPFQIERGRCTELARAWLARGWLYPRRLRKAAQGARFNGVYLPFWTFSAHIKATWRAEVGTETQEQYFDVDSKAFRTRTKIEWEWETGSTHLEFDNTLGAATTHIAPRILRALEPFDLSALVTYDPGYLAGWHAQLYEIPLESAWDSTRGEMRETARAACRKEIASSHVRNFSMNAAFDNEAWRLILLPVFVATYPFEKRVLQIAVNGQTGKVAGDKPVDWARVWLYTAALVVPGILLVGFSFALALRQVSSGTLFWLGAGLFIAGALIAVWVIHQALQSEG